MVVKKINIIELPIFINAAFENDEELIGLYDKSVEVETIEDICINVFEKIASLSGSTELRGVSIDGNNIGFFVFNPGYLISFGINVEYRNKKVLSDFWALIKKELGGTFQCALFSVNVRGINWLKKCGMNIIFENLTILQHKQ